MIQDPCQKRKPSVFKKSKSLSLFNVLKRTSIGVHKNIIYQHICMTKYILTVWSSFTSMRSELYWSGNSGQKSKYSCVSMYVLLADKVSCPMTQHFDSGDSQINNPSIPSLKPKSNVLDTVRALAKCWGVPLCYF